jgi:ribosomal protein L11 methyltransferase
MNGELLRVTVRAAADEREQAIAALLELAPDGFDEIQSRSEIEFGVYTDVAGEARLRAAFGTVGSTPVAPGWEDGWRAFHRPVRAGGIWIGPPWLRPPPGEPAVVIDPGRAFGTGTHPTTRLCVELLAGLELRGSLLDVGCGSGVLAIAAARLGFAPVVAIDDDPVAIEVTLTNAAANGVVVTAQLVDATHDRLPTAAAAVANVLLAPVEAILARLEVATVVTSGYLDREVPAHAGWSRAETATLDGWAADRFDRIEP